MNIGLLAVDSNYPNLALMKISSYHKVRGDKVDWYNPFDHYDKVYSGKAYKAGVKLVYTNKNTAKTIISGRVISSCKAYRVKAL